MEKSFGIIPVHLDEKKVYLIENRNGAFWGFPKGHLEEGEEEVDGAARELCEETGLLVKQVLREEPFIETYEYEKEDELIPKQVSYFLAEVSGKINLDTKEVISGEWIPFDEVAGQLTYPEAKELWDEIFSFLEKEA